MGGKLTLKSTLGKGSTFTVTLPDVRFSTEEKSSVEATGIIHIQTSSSDKKPCILIVDDVPVNMRVIQAMLRRLGVTDIILAGNGAEALAALEKNAAVDIVLTDMWMPVLDGEGLIKEIRAREQWKDLPVYAVTADVETQKTYKASGFTGILLKPVTLNQLQTLVG